MKSIIFFAFNEEKLIYRSISNIIKLFKKKFEIIVVNDGSKDKTLQEIKKIQNQFSDIVVIDKKKNEGIASAVYSGIEKSKFEYVSWLPSDGAYSENKLIDFYEKSKLDGTDLIIGFRNNKKSRSFYRYFLSEFLTFVLNLIFNEKIKDYNGVIIVNKNNLDLINLPVHPSFQWIIIVQLLKKKIKYKQIPIEMRIPEPGDGSSALNLKTFTSYFISLIKLIKIVFFKL